MSGLSFYYDCVLEVSDDDILRIFPSENNNNNNLALGAKANENRVDAALDYFKTKILLLDTKEKVNDNKNTKFILTHGDYWIDSDKKTVYFPFLSNIEIEVFRMGAVQGIAEDLNVEQVKYKDDNGNDKTFAAQYIAPYNCIVKISFSIPESISRYLPAWEWIPKILFAKIITCKVLKLFPLYKSNNLSELDKYSVIINELTSVDFNTEAFNPINSSGNGNDISFTRTFAGVSQKIYKKVTTEEYKKKRREDAIKEQEKKGNNKEELTVDKKVNSEKKEETSKIADAKSGFNNIMSAIGDIREEEKEDNGKKIPKLSFISKDLDFENVYFIEDTASESNGLLQYSALYNRMEKVHTFIPDTLDIYLSEPTFKSTKANSDTKKELSNSSISESGVAVQSSVANSEYIDVAIKNNPSIVGKKPDAFAMTVTLPFPIVDISLFDTVELIDSWLGLYDGFWKVLKINMKLDEKGQVNQQLNIVPSHFFVLASQKTEITEKKMPTKEGE